MPKITVVTPTKNRLKLLTETMASVSGQTLDNWEHIIVDDGSNDGSEEYVRRSAEADSRVRYIRRTDGEGGASACRNIGLLEARSNLIVFLDSDDLIEPECLARRSDIMEHNRDLDFVTFQTGVFMERPGDLGRQLSTELIGDDLLRFLYFDVPWQTTAPTWRRDSILGLGGFDENLPSWQDIDLHLRAIAGGFRYVRFAEVDHHMRWQFESTKVSVEQRRSPRHLNAAAALLQKFEDVLESGPGMNWVRQRALCSLYFFVAECWQASGDTKSALRAWSNIRSRALGPWHLHAAGAFLLILASLGLPTQRAIHKWKGWMRLRNNPELVPPKRSDPTRQPNGPCLADAHPDRTGRSAAARRDFPR